MQYWGLPSNERDAMTLFKKHVLLTKKPVCEYNHDANLHFGKQIC